MDIQPNELKLADGIAHSIGQRWRRVPTDDVVSELRLWLASNVKYLVAWREEGDLGWNKLRASLRRRANAFCREEHNIQKPWQRTYVYTAEAAGQALTLIFNYSDWTEISADGDSDVWSTLVDISAAFDSLSRVDRKLLRLRFERELPYADIADALSLVSSDAARMRVNRALARVVDRASDATVRWPAKWEDLSGGYAAVDE